MTKRKLSEMGFVPIIDMQVTPIQDQYGHKGGLLVVPIVIAEVTRTEFDMMTGQVVSEETGPMRVPLAQASVIYTLN